MGTQELLGLVKFEGSIEDFILIAALIFTRFIVCLNTVPFLGGQQVSPRFKVSLAAALTAFTYPFVEPSVPRPLPEMGLVWLGLFSKEAIFAFLISLTISIVFYGLQSAGNMVDNQRQLANAQIFNPSLGSQVSLFGLFYFQLAIVMFLLLGGHRLFLGGVIESFQTVPITTFPTWATEGISVSQLPSLPLIKLITGLAAKTISLAIQLSAPVLVAIFLADLILGLTNRIAPMVNVFDMGFNIKGWLGVALVYLSFPVILDQMQKIFSDFYRDFNKMIAWFLTGG